MPLNVLLVEDDEEMCEELKYILKNKGYEVGVAHCALAGIDMVKTGLYQLVLLDIKMPNVSGKEVLRFVKANYPQLKTIILTGSPLDIPELESVESGDFLFQEADDVMNKPFDIEKLLLKIEQLSDVR